MAATPVLSLVILLDLLEAEDDLAGAIGPALAPGLSRQVFGTLNIKSQCTMKVRKC